KGELTRAAIVEAAHDLIITQGYHGTSMRQIAQEAGIALGGIYNHFSSKEDIFRAIFLDNHPYGEMIPAIESAQGETLEEFVRDAATQMLSAINRRPDFLNLMFIEIVEFKSAHAHELFEALFPRGLQVVELMASKDGKLRSVPAPMLMRAFMGFFISYHLADVVLGRVAPPEFSENAMAYYVDIFLHGILEKE
ncbi:MAG: TetR/AcrR family transcriptional regulator, partial [Chloroflexi bacterium]|nr:TetR/AcrR family transcriptional regulator [Chloroflexota bacterium]